MSRINWIFLVRHYTDIPDKTKFQSNDEVYEEEIGDGNLNEVWRLYTKDNAGQVDKSIIIKHSLPYIKCLGEGYPLGEQRIDIEYKALVQFHILSPGSVPIPYTHDKENNAVCMEDLRGYEMLRCLLMRGEFEPTIASSIGKKLAAVHAGTHVGTIGADRLTQLDKDFENSNMTSLSEQFIFTRPFTEGDETNKCSAEVKEILQTIYGDHEVLAAVKKMLKLFLEKKECLIHGDLHTGSILVKDQDARIMDMEFACVGPSAFDLGLLIANYIFSYYRNMSIEENNEERRQVAYKMIDACKNTVQAYISHMTTAMDCGETYENNLLSEVAGFAGCEIVRRLIGAAHNADLDGMPLAERECLGAGVRLLKAVDRIQDIDRLLVIALMLA